MGARIWRGLAITTLAAVVLVVGVLVVAHTRWARGRALAWAENVLSTRYHLLLTADALNYNILSGRVSVSGVRLAATTHGSRPFFAAKRIDASLPWSVYRGVLSLNHVTVDGGIVTIERGDDGVLNVPAGDGQPAGLIARRLELAGLSLRQLAVRYDDARRGVSLDVPAIDAELTRDPLALRRTISGAFAVHGTTNLRVRGRTLGLQPTETRLSFDGSSVAVGGLRLAGAEGDLVVSGDVRRVLDAPALALEVDGTADLEKSAAWAPPPVPVSGRVQIRGSVTGAMTAIVAELRASGTEASVGLEHGLRIEGPVRVTEDGARSDGLTLTPSTGGVVSATFDVPFTDASSRIEAEWRGLDAQSAFRLGALEARPVGSLLTGRLTFTIGPERRLELANHAVPKPSPGLMPVGGTARVTLTGDTWSIDHSHETAGLTMAGAASGVLYGKAEGPTTVKGHQDVHVSDLADAARSVSAFDITLPELVRTMRGSLDAALQISGTFAAPVVSGPISGRNLDVPSVGRTSIEARIDINTERAHISTIEAHRGAATLVGDVTVNLKSRQLSGVLDLDAPDAADLQGALPEGRRVSGPLTAHGTVGGTLRAFRLDATVTGSSMSFAGHMLDRVSAATSVTADTLDLSALQIVQGTGQLGGHARYTFGPGRYEASLKGDGLTYQGSILAPSDAKATVSLQFDGAGTIGDPRGIVTGGFTVTGGTAATMIGTGDYTVELLGDRARVRAHVPSLDALVTGTVGTTAPYDYQAIAVLNRVPLEPLAALTPARPDSIHGTVSLTATASGAIGQNMSPIAFMNLQDITARIGAVPLTLASPARLAWKGNVLTVDALDLGVGNGRLTASGEWAAAGGRQFDGTFTGTVEDALSVARAFDVPTSVDGTGDVTIGLRWSGDAAETSGTLTLRDGSVARVGHPAPVTGLAVDATMTGHTVTVSRLSGHVSASGLDGDFSASARATVPTLSLDDVTASLTVDSAAFTSSGVPLTQQQPSRVDLAHGVVTASDVAWTIADNPLILSGTVTLSPPEDPALDLSLDGGANLRVLSAFFPGLAFDGGLAIETRLTGTARAPKFNGGVWLEAAEIAIAQPRLVLSELAGPVRLDGDRIRVDGVTGMANGGAVTLNGELRFDRRAIASGEIALQAKDVTVEFPRGMRSEVDAALSLRIDSQGPLLTGDVRVLRGAYTETITLAALAASSTTRSMTSGETSYLDSVRLDVAITTVDNLSVDNNYGRFEAGGSVRVVGRIGEPGMTGSITLEEGGQIYLAGRTFTLDHGDVSFTHLRRIEPEFNIAAKAQVSGDEVTMTLSGTLDHPRLDLTPKDGSKTPSQLAAEIVGVSSGVGAESALTLLSADLLGLTGRAIGLDALRVERGEIVDSDYRDDPAQYADQGDPATRLTIAKRLRSNVEVTLSQNLSENGKTTVVLSYFILPSLELRALSRDNATVGLVVSHHVSIGGGRTERPVSRAQAPEVSAITFTGATPEFDAWARQHVRLTPGRRFVFVRWQSDIDRLRARLREQGFFEAHLRARRTVTDDAQRVALDYIVDAGPATTLTVAGISLPSSERRDLEDAWTRSGFDRFLIDDLSRRLGRYLVSAGYFDSNVTGVVERPAPGEKRVHLLATPGTRVARRDIEFTGNTGLSRSQLEAIVKSAGLDLTAWLDPAALEQSVHSAYRAEGYLQAAVAVGRPRIDGDVARLPVSIVEGRQAQVTAVQWSGVADARRAKVEEATGLKTPTPFVALAVADASRRVEQSYRSQGFNNVQVEVSSALAPDSTVALTFVIVEGLQQVLQDVEPVGARRTSGRVITDALHLRIGDPVNLDEWALARKRLYDTNLFRQVQVQPVPLSPAADGVQPVRAQVTVEEYPAWRLRYGAQIEGERAPTIDDFASRRNLGLVAVIGTQNLRGRALGYTVLGRYQSDFRDATMFLSSPRFFGLAAKSSIYGLYSRDLLRGDAREVVAISDRIGATAEQRWHARGWQVAYSYHFEKSHTLDPEPLPNDPSPLDFTANLARVATSAFLERRDDALNPRRGTFTAIGWQQSARWLASDITNRKLLFQQFVFIPVGRVVLASRAQSGIVFGPDEPLPTDRFRAGGATTVRGYGEDSLGPRDIFGLPSGGRTLLVLNQEARFPIHRWVSGVGFLDAGGIVAKGRPFGAGILKIGYGFGLRFNTPVGIFRTDFGIPGSALPVASTRQPNSFGGGLWYFGIGHIF